MRRRGGPAPGGLGSRAPGGFEGAVPDQASFTRLRAASRELASLSDGEVVAGLSRALDLWKGPRGHAARAAGEIARATGVSEDMLAFGLRRTIAAHSRAGLARWIRAARAEACPGACGPEVVLQVLAGNVAGLALPAVMEALLARSAVVVKPAAEEPVTARLFKRSLDRAAPTLGRAVAVAEWRGGDEAVESRVFAAADLVVASGGEAMADSVAARVPGPLVVYGPRVSIGLVGSGWREAPAAWWSRAAREIALWEQAGCLSPRVLFVAGDRGRFAARLGEALAALERRWPAPARTAGEASAILAFRARYEMGDMRARGIVAPAAPAWTVVWDDAPSLDLGPAARVVRVTALPDPRALASLLTASDGQVQGVGLAWLGGREAAYRRALEGTGVGFVTPLDAIQNPPAGWRADGRSGLVELLQRGRARELDGAGMLTATDERKSR